MNGKVEEKTALTGECPLTPKQEAFCLAYIEIGNASEAYRSAYDADAMKAATINRAAKTLLDNSKIAARVAELRSVHIERHKLTVDDLLEELEAARLLALSPAVAAPAAAVSATMGKAKLLGLLVEQLKANVSHSLPIVGPDAFC